MYMYNMYIIYYIFMYVGDDSYLTQKNFFYLLLILNSIERQIDICLLNVRTSKLNLSLTMIKI